MTTLTSVDGEVTFGSGHPTVICAMTINTHKDEELAAELAVGKLDLVKRLAEKQRLAGVGFMHVMITHPELDEAKLLPEVCMAAHDASGLSLYIDCTNVETLTRTLDVFPYKAIIPVAAKEEDLNAVLPLVKESGSAVIGLCMDEHGVPDTAKERLELADKIWTRATGMGIPQEDVVIDPLCMTIAVAPPDGLRVTLEVLREVKERYDATTFVGIDNAGYGMPQKDLIDMAYLLAAIPAGMDVALVEPPTCSSLGLEGFTLFFAGDFMSGNDPYGKRYLTFIREHDLIDTRK